MPRTYKAKSPHEKPMPLELTCDRCAQVQRVWCGAPSHCWPWHRCAATWAPQPFSSAREVEADSVPRR